MRFKVTINAKQLARPLGLVGARKVELNEVPGGRKGSVGRVVLIATSAGGASLAGLSPEWRRMGMEEFWDLYIKYKIASDIS